MLMLISITAESTTVDNVFVCCFFFVFFFGFGVYYLGNTCELRTEPPEHHSSFLSIITIRFPTVADLLLKQCLDAPVCLCVHKAKGDNKLDL